MPKCTNCGELLTDKQVFCSKCGQKVKKKETLSDKMDDVSTSVVEKKGSNTLKILFIIEGAVLVVLPILLFAFASTLSTHKAYTAEEFKELAEKNGYEKLLFEEMTDEEDDAKGTYCAMMKEDTVISYVEAEDEATAEKLFNEEKGVIGAGESTINTEYLSYQLLHTTVEGKVYHMVRIDNTVLYTNYLETANEEEAMAVPNEMGYGLEKDYPMMVYLLIPGLLFIIVLQISLWKLFVKAGYVGWYSLIPIYNFYIITKMVYHKSIFFILFLVMTVILSALPLAMYGAFDLIEKSSVRGITSYLPIYFLLTTALAVMECFFLYRFPKVFGKSKSFSICNILFTPITMQILAFDDSIYDPEEKCDKVM